MIAVPLDEFTQFVVKVAAPLVTAPPDACGLIVRVWIAAPLVVTPPEALNEVVHAEVAVPEVIAPPEADVAKV